MSTSMPAAASKRPRPRWQKIAIVVAGVLVAMIVIGAIVGPKKPDRPPAADAAPTSAAASTTESSPTAEHAVSTTAMRATESSVDALASYAADLSSRPKPTDAQVREIAVALVDIQPEMAEIKVSRVETSSDSVCGDIWTWADGQSGNTTLAVRAANRFDGGDRPQLTEEQGQRIVDVIKRTYCHP